MVWLSYLFVQTTYPTATTMPTIWRLEFAASLRFKNTHKTTVSIYPHILSHYIAFEVTWYVTDILHCFFSHSTYILHISHQQVFQNGIWYIFVARLCGVVTLFTYVRQQSDLEGRPGPSRWKPLFVFCAATK